MVRYPAQDRYDKANMRRYQIVVNIKTEPEVARRLDEVSNKSGYVKSLIRKDIEYKIVDF